MLPISSLQNPVIKLIRALADKKARRAHGLFVAEGLAMLARAEAEGHVPEYLLATRLPHLFDGVKPTLVTAKVMAEVSAQNNPHEVLGVFKQRWQAHPARQGTWLALEEIRDTGNLGSIMRTADAASAAGLILVGACCDAYAPECVRASTGSIFALPLVRMPLAQFIDFVKTWPGTSLAARSDAATDFRKAQKAPHLIVLGSEAKGISDSLSSACSVSLKIPMKSGVESLNLAAAAALMLYQVQV